MTSWHRPQSKPYPENRPTGDETPSEDRRTVRASADGVEVPDGYVLRTTREAASMVECPKCGVGAGSSCVNPSSGAGRNSSHEVRHHLAVERGAVPLYMRDGRQARARPTPD